MSLANLKTTVDELVQLTPVAVQKISDLRAAGLDPAELQAIADVLTERVSKPLATALAGPQS